MITGWLLPDGTHVFSEEYEHIYIALSTPALRTMLNEQLLDALEGVRDTMDTCNALCQAGEHGEWHIYEMACSDYEACGGNAQVWAELLDGGCARFGILDGTKLMKFELRAEHLFKLRPHAEELAYKHKRHADFEIMK